MTRYSVFCEIVVEAETKNHARNIVGNKLGLFARYYALGLCRKERMWQDAEKSRHKKVGDDEH